jgi:acetyl esterase/lipase
MRMALVGVLVAAWFGPVPRARAQTPNVRSIKDIPYATVAGKTLGLDLYLPEGGSNPGLFVWVHGGAWRSGSKSTVPVGLTRAGFAVASLDFRMSTDAPFPAMVHDIKGAIRFLRANAAKYGYRADRIAIGGDSSGGHLAVLVGVTAGNAELEARSAAMRASRQPSRPSSTTTAPRTSRPSWRSRRRLASACARPHSSCSSVRCQTTGRRWPSSPARSFMWTRRIRRS